MSAQMKTRIDLTHSQKKYLWVTDNIDYSGLQWNINDVVCLLTITGPKGVFYKNTNKLNPDIIPATSKKSIRLITMPMDPFSKFKEILRGNYTVKLTAVNTVSNDTHEVLFTYSYTFTEPEVKASIQSGPYSGTLKSTDITELGNHVKSTSRTHRIKYPVQLDPLVEDIVSSNEYIEVFPTYTNIWTIQLSLEVEYENPDTLEIIWANEKSFEHCVYGGCINDMAAAINNMLNNYYIQLACNIGNQEAAQKRIVIVNNAWHLLNLAYQNGDVDDADRLSAIIYDQVKYTGHGLCGGPTSVEVVPCPPYIGGGGGGGAEYTFSNALTLIGGNVNYGGALIKNTSVNIATYSHTLSASGGGGSISILSQLGTGHRIEVSSGSTQGGVFIQGNKVLLEYKDIVDSQNTKSYEVAASGLIEKADYRSTYTERTLVAKDYVDSNNNWGSQFVITDATLSGKGITGEPLSVASPFPGFTTLEDDYGYVEPTHSFSEITNKPTTLSGYGITDAVTNFLQLTDTPASYSGHAQKFLRVKATADGLEFSTTSGFVPDTGGTFTGQVIIFTDNDYPLVLRQLGSGGVVGVPEGGKNMIGFRDGDNDLQGEIGIDNAGNVILNTFVSGGKVYVPTSLHVASHIVVDGLVDGVDISVFKTDFDNHTHTYVSSLGDMFQTEFTVKSTAHEDDIVLIEDSQSSFAKKYLSLKEISSTFDPGSHTHPYEPLLGSPSVSGYVLSSTTGGVRSWVPSGANWWNRIGDVLSPFIVDDDVAVSNLYLMSPKEEVKSKLLFYDPLTKEVTYNDVAIDTKWENAGDIDIVYGFLYNWHAIHDKYDDWFLPSRDELDEMYLNLKANGLGSFDNAIYLSSSESTATTCHAQNFSDGTMDSSFLKSASAKMRPCRVFVSERVLDTGDPGDAGGLIFTFINNQDGTYTYYEAAPSDYGFTVVYSNLDDEEISLTGTQIGDGQQNTLYIMLQIGHTNSGAEAAFDAVYLKQKLANTNTGFRVPSTYDWTELLEYVEINTSYDEFETGKAIGTCRQIDHPTKPECDISEHPRWDEFVGGTKFCLNDFKMSVTPGGTREVGGGSSFYGYMGILASHHTSDEYDQGNMIVVEFDYEYPIIQWLPKEMGASIRLVRPATLDDPETDGATCADYIGNDGRPYKTVRIGGQVWTTGSLVETRYNDGGAIPNVPGDEDWFSLTTGGRCYYENNLDYAYTGIGNLIKPKDDKKIRIEDFYVDGEDKGKIILTNIITGTPEYAIIDTEVIPDIGRQIVVSVEEKKIVLSLDQTKINHNLLMSFEDDRHRKMNYDENVKAYLIEP